MNRYYEYLGYVPGRWRRNTITFKCDSNTMRELQVTINLRSWADFGGIRPNGLDQYYFHVNRDANQLDVMEYFASYKI
jgi:hypothetical protein